MKLSVLRPAYNGAATLAEAIKAVLAVVHPCEMKWSAVMSRIPASRLSAVSCLMRRRSTTKQTSRPDPSISPPSHSSRPPPHREGSALRVTYLDMDGDQGGGTSAGVQRPSRSAARWSGCGRAAGTVRGGAARQDLHLRQQDRGRDGQSDHGRSPAPGPRRRRLRVARALLPLWDRDATGHPAAPCPPAGLPHPARCAGDPGQPPVACRLGCGALPVRSRIGLESAAVAGRGAGLRHVHDVAADQPGPVQRARGRVGHGAADSRPASVARLVAPAAHGLSGSGRASACSSAPTRCFC
jgi:hypothetical protein